MKILLIEDSALSRNMFRRALGGEHEYYEATDGMTGIETYFLEKPDLVVLDLTMPGMNGIDVLARIKQLDPGAKVVVGTADIQEMTRRQAEELGASGFITKPFTHESVREVINQVWPGAGI